MNDIGALVNLSLGLSVRLFSRHDGRISVMISRDQGDLEVKMPQREGGELRKEPESKAV